MASAEVLSVDPCRAMQREAVRFLQAMMNRASVRPMPGGRTRLDIEVSNRFFDQLCEWGSEAEDLEDGADDERDARELPKLRQPLPAVFSAALLISSPGTPELTSLKPLPPEMVALAERIPD